MFDEQIPDLDYDAAAWKCSDNSIFTSYIRQYQDICSKVKRIKSIKLTQAHILIHLNSIYVMETNFLKNLVFTLHSSSF